MTQPDPGERRRASVSPNRETIAHLATRRTPTQGRSMAAFRSASHVSDPGSSADGRDAGTGGGASHRLLGPFYDWSSRWRRPNPSRSLRAVTSAPRLGHLVVGQDISNHGPRLASGSGSGACGGAAGGRRPRSVAAITAGVDVTAQPGCGPSTWGAPQLIGCDLGGVGGQQSGGPGHTTSGQPVIRNLFRR